MRFTVNHKRRQFDTHITYEQANLHIAELLKKKIQQDIIGGIYDETQMVYRKMIEDKTYYKSSINDPELVYNLATLYNDYVLYQKKKRVFNGDEIPVNYVSASNMLKRWGVIKLSEVQHITVV